MSALLLALAGEVAATIPLGVVALTGALGVAGVVAIGSAVIALGGRRTRDDEPEPVEEVAAGDRP